VTTARKIPKNANEFIEQQLDERLNSLADAFQSDALTFYGSLIVGADDAIRIAVEDLRQRSGARDRLTLILTTPGGFIEVVQRMASPWPETTQIQ